MLTIYHVLYSFLLFVVTTTLLGARTSTLCLYGVLR
jgi:hypothetical protein